VKERPIIFSGEMVRAILDDRKTQTRRVVKPQPEDVCDNHEYAFEYGPAWPVEYPDGSNPAVLMRCPEDHDCNLCEAAYQSCPYGEPGDRLWVRESGKLTGKGFTGENGERWSYCDGSWKYKEDGLLRFTNQVAWGPNWKSVPSIHMPRWASRITLEVVDVRVERLQSISEEDAVAEGCVKVPALGDCVHEAREQFEYLWDSINAKRGYSWSSNPWCWAVTFKRIKP
jgi:hypothetical protein